MAGCFTSMIQPVMATTTPSKVKREAESTDDEVFYSNSEIVTYPPLTKLPIAPYSDTVQCCCIRL